VRRIDFNDLPRTTREQFVRSLVSLAPGSRPLCQRVSASRGAAGWYVLLALAAAGLIALGYIRFGSIHAPVQDRRFLGGYVTACAALGLSVSMLARRRAIKGSLPFAPGVYVFPLELVDARTRELELHSLSELQSFEVVHHSRGDEYSHSALWFVFPTKSVVIQVRGREEADRQLGAVQKAKASLAAAILRGEAKDAAAFDPFADARSRDFRTVRSERGRNRDFASVREHGLLARERPAWTRFVWAITVVSGLVFGVATWRLRNWQSDASAFARLAAAPDVSLGEAYVRGGGLHAAEAKDEILPRAFLAEAMKEPAGVKRAEAVEHFLDAHPRTKVDGEARAALAEAIHVEFTSKSATVSGLRAFITRWPDVADVPAARAKIHALYQQTLADFQKHANTSDKSVMPVVEALLAYSEERAAPIDVRFRRRGAATLANADKLLAKGLLDDDGPAAGGNAEVSPHLGDTEASRREAALVLGIERSLGTLFPAEVIALRLGAPLDEAASGTKPLPKVAQPTIIVDYEVGWAGSTYLTRDTHRRYLGILVKFDVVVQMPTDARSLSFSMNVEPPESITLDYAPALPIFQALVPSAPHGNAVGAADDARVYSVMLLRAFDRLATKMLPVFFDPRTAASREPLEGVRSPLPSSGR
jgi:hypothetical protein